MNRRILVVGGGGREHALVWKLAQSDGVEEILVGPGNGGTDSQNVSLDVGDIPGLVDFARAAQIDLTVIGPEAPLAAGVVDAFAAAGLRCFGPAQGAAMLETSKAFSKDFMARHDIPTARYEVFEDLAAARAFVETAPWPVVIKASGLAAGKGVIVPESNSEALAALDRIMIDKAFGAAGDQVIVEERLIGEEVSILALCDGHTAVPLLPARDHKRALDGDLGPNTGGMGAYAPTHALSTEALDTIRRTVLQRTVDGMRAEGNLYKGVLYAGLMLTPDGPRVLEFNCRFGDPETQVVLPLLDADLARLMSACIEGTLDEGQIKWRPGAAATVVMASEGYPGSYPKGRPITGIEAAEAHPDTLVFQAGTRRDDTGELLTSGGRVLSVTGLGTDLSEALALAYAGVDQIHFEGAQHRRDIGAHAQEPQT